MNDKELLDNLDCKKISARKIKIPFSSLELEPYKPSFFEAEVGEPYYSGKRSRGEIKCRKVLEKYFNKEFHCYRPDWLNYNGYNLELDLFNPELGLACEYHGIQHYIYPSRFIKKKANFIAQLRRDLYKLSVCKKMGIYVLVVPYVLPCREIKQYIKTKLEEIK